MIIASTSARLEDTLRVRVPQVYMNSPMKRFRPASRPARANDIAFRSLCAPPGSPCRQSLPQGDVIAMKEEGQSVSSNKPCFPRAFDASHFPSTTKRNDMDAVGAAPMLDARIGRRDSVSSEWKGHPIWMRSSPVKSEHIGNIVSEVYSTDYTLRRGADELLEATETVIWVQLRVQSALVLRTNHPFGRPPHPRIPSRSTFMMFHFPVGEARNRVSCLGQT